MAYNEKGYRLENFMGTPDTSGGAGTNRRRHTFITNDDQPTIETANYFDAILDRCLDGDTLEVVYDVDGNVGRAAYVLKKVNSHVTLIGETDDSAAGARAVVPTADGLTTGLLYANDKYVAVASAGANDIVTLPAIATVPLGKEIWGQNNGTACELRTPATSTTKINNGQADSNEAVLAANTWWMAKKVSTTQWALITGVGGALVAPTPD